jgi:hypothetical protein
MPRPSPCEPDTLGPPLCDCLIAGPLGVGVRTTMPTRTVGGETYTIRYCSLHAAAPTLVEETQHLLILLRDLPLARLDPDAAVALGRAHTRLAELLARLRLGAGAP